MMGNGVQSDTGTRGEGERVAVPGKVHPPGNALPDPGAPTRAPRPVCPGARRRHGGPGVPQEHAVLPADQPEHGRGAERCGALPPSTGRAGAPLVGGSRGCLSRKPKMSQEGPVSINWRTQRKRKRLAHRMFWVRHENRILHLAMATIFVIRPLAGIVFFRIGLYFSTVLGEFVLLQRQRGHSAGDDVGCAGGGGGGWSFPPVEY